MWGGPSSWNVSEVRKINPLLPQQAKSQIDHLIGIAATNEEELCALAEWHEELLEQRVLCVFQLPFAFSEINKPIILPTLESGVFVEARAVPQYVCCDLKGNIFVSNATDSSLSDVWHRRVTRCVISVPIWGKRAQYYDDYQVNCLNENSKNRIIIPAHESWIMDRALNTEDYEYNLVKRMLREVMHSIRIFLKAIRVTTLFPCDHDYQFSGMFWMPTPGRVTYTQPPRSIVAEILQSSDSGREVVIPDLDNAIRHRIRKVTKFERSLMSLESMRRRGDPKAALMGVMAVIESVLKETLRSKATLFGLLRDERLGNLNANDKMIADTGRRTRNAILHEYLSTEIDSGRSYISKEDRAALEADLDRLCVDAIQSARNIFRYLNRNF